MKQHRRKIENPLKSGKEERTIKVSIRKVYKLLNIVNYVKNIFPL